MKGLRFLFSPDILFSLLFFYISLVPYYYFQPQILYQTLPPFFFLKYFPFLIAGLIGVIWFFEKVKYGRPIRRTPIDTWTALFLFISFLSVVNSNSAQITLAKWFYYNSTGISLAFLLFQYADSWDFIRRCVEKIGWLWGGVILYTLASTVFDMGYIWGDVHAEMNPYYTKERAIGPFGNSVSTATYIVFFLPLSIWMAVHAQRVLVQKINAVFSLSAVPAVLYTQTRAALIVMLVSLCIIVPYLLGKLNKRDRYKAIGGVGFAIVSSIALCYGTAIFNEDASLFNRLIDRWSDLLSPSAVVVQDGDRVYTYNSMLEYTERYRIAQYGTVCNILKSNPYFGVGFGNYALVFDEYRYTETYLEREFIGLRTAENMYLMLAAELGLIGVISFLAVMAVICYTIVKHLRQSKDAVRRDFLLLFLTSWCGILLHMLTWDILNDPTLRMMFWSAVGLGLAAADLDDFNQI